MSILAEPTGDRLGALLGPRAARVLTTYAVPCLHYAHWQALWRYRLADWANDTTYGTDRYHCLCATLGRIAEQRLPRANVHLPTERLGTPFTIVTGRSVIYPWRYGKTRADRHEGLPLSDDTGIRAQVVGGGPPGQEALEYEGLPAVPLSNVVVLAWAGNRHEGLTRAFLASPYLYQDALYWREDTFLELDVEAGRGPYVIPSVPEVPPPPKFDITLLDSDLGVDFSASDDEPTGTE